MTDSRLQREATFGIRWSYLEDVLQKLASHSQRISTVVEYRYFAGMTMAEIAQAVGVSERTVADDWVFAKAWLRRELRH